MLFLPYRPKSLQRLRHFEKIINIDENLHNDEMCVSDSPTGFVG